jgi:hypothetical protein
VLPGALWEKHPGAESLSNSRAKVGSALLAYFEAVPDLLGRYRKIGRFIAVKAIADTVKAGEWRAAARDVAAFRRLGLLPLDLRQLRADYREVSRFRREYRRAGDPNALATPRAEWR